MYVGHQRLFQRRPVGILPNLSILAHLPPVAAPPRRVALFGPPSYQGSRLLKELKGAQAEIAELAELGARRLMAPPITGGLATEAALRDLATRRDARGALLHVACHGSMEPGDPLRSGLLVEGGRMDASEIATLDIDYDEVVLSACSTGWRTVDVPGDEALGLPAALLEAGVAASIVSIPLADDEVAREFMVAYHQERFAGRTPLYALQATQLRMLDQEPFVYRFGGFVAYAAS